MIVLENLISRRLVVVIVLLMVSIAVTEYGVRSISTPSENNVSFNAFPTEIGQWSYVSKQTFGPDVIEMLGTDAYIDYIYRSAKNEQAEVLVSYYSSMHEGKQFHSPKNCMLGSGWETLKNKQVKINWRGKPAYVNYMLVTKDKQTLSVLYWVQGRGRLMASEYQERVYRVIDGFTKKRSDGAFVRITLPGHKGESEYDLTVLTGLGERVASDVESIVPK
jgi:EpsI family protein